jgi:hypothetical protein
MEKIHITDRTAGNSKRKFIERYQFILYMEYIWKSWHRKTGQPGKKDGRIFQGREEEVLSV